MGKSLILDTNAFIYLMNIEKGDSNNIQVEKKRVDDAVFYDYCRNADYLFVTSQTLYELFWQSIEKTGDIEQFAILYDALAKYRRIYGSKFSVLNDVNGMFNLKLFEKQFFEKNVDISYFVEQKRIYECEKIERLINFFLVSVVDFSCMTLGLIMPDEFLRGFADAMNQVVSSSLESISDHYYKHPGTDNSYYDDGIDQTIAQVVSAFLKMANEALIAAGQKEVIIRKTSSGAEMVHLLFCQMKKINKTIFLKYSNYLDDMGSTCMKERGESEESCKFWKRLFIRCAEFGAKIKKNDGLDYSIITCLAKTNIVNQTHNSVDIDNTFAVTFDKNLYSFQKECNVLYNEEIYDDLVAGKKVV